MYWPTLVIRTTLPVSRMARRYRTGEGAAEAMRPGPIAATAVARRALSRCVLWPGGRGLARARALAPAMADGPGGVPAGEHPIAESRQESVAREVAAGAVAGEAGGGAAAGVEIRHRRAVGSENAGGPVHHEPALGVEQGTGHLHPVERRLQPAAVPPAERVSLPPPGDDHGPGAPGGERD